jgi:uncharacterized HAD superfamily protein/adenine/guanine phosphoribosyltransferase-like PRPP-binding protein
MNYRSLADLEECIARNLYKVPRETDLVVGIPRSGLMVGSLLALHLNLPLTDLAGVLENRVISAGQRFRSRVLPKPADCRRLLVIDDSIYSGRAMQRARETLRAAGFDSRATYVAVYATQESVSKLDTHFEVCPPPRVFAWNMMHRADLNGACVDLDGVLCVDPTEQENDDGPNYLNFIANARPLLRPTCEIGAIVTCRLEKYRNATEAWLQKEGIKYRQLVMWDLPDKLTRQSLGGHGKFKASFFRSQRWAYWFVESSAVQAQEIADGASKPVICVEDQSVHLAGASRLVHGAVTNAHRWAPRALKRTNRAFVSLLLRMNQQ